MSLQTSTTPTPPTQFAPVQVEVADYLDIASHDKKSVFKVNRFGGQAIDVQKIGGQPHDSVEIDVTGVNGAESLTNEASVEASSLERFGNPTTAGPLATSRFEWNVNNRGNTDYTESNGNPYKTHINYILRPLSVAEKLKRGFPLTQEEKNLASKYGLDSIANAGLPIKVPAVIRPTMETKELIEDKEVATTIDITNTGSSSAVNVASEKNLRSNNQVVYINRLELNTGSFDYSNGITVQFVRDNVDVFYELTTNGVPGQADYYSMDLHIPFTEQMDVNVYANGSSTGVDIKMKYSVVARTIVEKSLYGLENEVSNMNLYNEVSNRLKAGVRLQSIMGSS